MIVHRDSAAGLTADRLRGGFFAGWPAPPSPEVHLRLLLQSDLVELAIDDETGDVVGFATAITDGVMFAFIPLLEVLPDRQGRGIGTELVRRLLSRLERIYAVDLVCDPGLEPFYGRLGLQPGRAMMLRHRGEDVVHRSGP